MAKMNFGIGTGLVSATALIAGSQGAMAQGLDGFYAGLSINSMGGQMPWNDDSDDDYQLSSAATLGFFAGYNWTQPSGLVMGVEFALQGTTPGDDADNAGSSSDDYEMKYLADAKLRLGKVFASPMGDVLGYGFGGLSHGSMNANSGGDYGAIGLNYGLGAEVAVSGNIFVGLEFIGRSMNGYHEDGVSKPDRNHGIGLRTAFRF